jgi:hypothetical protein
MRTIKSITELFQDCLDTSKRVEAGMVFCSGGRYFIATRIAPEQHGLSNYTALFMCYDDGSLSLISPGKAIKDATIQMVMNAHDAVLVGKIEGYTIKVQ